MGDSIAAYPDGVNFSMFSQAATEVLLLLFDSATAVEPMLRMPGIDAVSHAATSQR